MLISDGMANRMRNEIREIRKNDDGGQYQFNVFIMNKKECGLSMKFLDPFNQYKNKYIDIKIPNKRLIQLANDILNYFHKEAEFEKFEPTIADFEKKLGDQFRVECYVIDLIRSPFQIETTKKIYEWLKGNEDWIYSRKN